MLRAAIFVACIALLIILINSMAEHRAENELVLRCDGKDAHVPA
jgi:hypothetical protein